jgi:hypothetical protein
MSLTLGTKALDTRVYAVAAEGRYCLTLYSALAIIAVIKVTYAGLAHFTCRAKSVGCDRKTAWLRRDR